MPPKLKPLFGTRYTCIEAQMAVFWGPLDTLARERRSLAAGFGEALELRLLLPELILQMGRAPEVSCIRGNQGGFRNWSQVVVFPTPVRLELLSLEAVVGGLVPVASP